MKVQLKCGMCQIHYNCKRQVFHKNISNYKEWKIICTVFSETNQTNKQTILTIDQVEKLLLLSVCVIIISRAA